MLYEFWENFKIKVYNFLNPQQPFVPAGVTPIAEPTAENHGFSFSSLKPANLKDLSFETKRLLVLGATFLAALLILAYMKADYASYSSARATVSSQTSTSIQSASQSSISNNSTPATTLSEPPIDD